MKTVEIIELLDKDANKYGGTTGKERELNLSINGDFVGSIESAKLDGWGDGLVTDVTLEVQVSDIDYHDRKIREKAIDDFANLMYDKVDQFDVNYECRCDNGVMHDTLDNVRTLINIVRDSLKEHEAE